MKNIITILCLSASLGALITINSCKKAESTTDDSISAADVSNVSSALNGTTDDVTNQASINSSFSDKVGAFEQLCGAVLGADPLNGNFTLAYSGPDCTGAINRQGTISVTMLNYQAGASWRTIGTTLQVVYNNLTFTNIASGVSYTLNGTHYITNVTGGQAWQIMDGTAAGVVSYKYVAENFTVTFGNGMIKKWSLNRTRTFTSSGTATARTITLSADTTINYDNNVEIWGTNSNGDQFESSIMAPVISNNVCGYYHPVSGQYMQFISDRSMGLYPGYGSSLNPLLSSTCPIGYKITYIYKGLYQSKINNYWF